jgi:hypothetical protein
MPKRLFKLFPRFDAIELAIQTLAKESLLDKQ